MTAEERGWLVAEGRQVEEALLLEAYVASAFSEDPRLRLMAGVVGRLADELEASTATLTPEQAQKLAVIR